MTEPAEEDVICISVWNKTKKQDALPLSNGLTWTEEEELLLYSVLVLHYTLQYYYYLY